MSFFSGPQFPELMVDIETLSTEANAVILSVAAVFFNIETRQFATPAFYEEIDPDTQTERHIDPKTVAWWGKQNRLMPRGTTSLKTALENLLMFVHRHPPARVWANSPSFDLIIIKHACKQHDLGWPIPFWQERDVRTTVDIAKTPKNFAANHDAVQDCLSQIRLVTDSFASIILK